MAEEIGDGTGLRYGVTESVVGVGGNGFASRVKVAGYVSVVVIERDVDRVVDRKVEESADATSTLQRAGEVFAPIVVNGRYRAVRIGDALLDKIPIIIEEGRYCFRRHLADAAGLCIVEVRQNEDAVGRDCFQAVGSIVGEGEDTIGEQIAVVIVGWLPRRHGVTED